jgi:hypothetical protein
MGSREWAPTEIVAVFFAFVVAAGLALQLLVWRAKRKVRRRHVVIEPWLPIVAALRERGVTAPETIATVLASWDLRLDPPCEVGARLPSGVATVADALGLTLAQVQRPLVDRAADAAGAAPLLEELRALRPRLDGLPGVREVGALWPDDPETFAKMVVRYAAMCAVSHRKR